MIRIRVRVGTRVRVRVRVSARVRVRVRIRFRVVVRVITRLSRFHQVDIKRFGRYNTFWFWVMMKRFWLKRNVWVHY